MGSAAGLRLRCAIRRTCPGLCGAHCAFLLPTNPSVLVGPGAVLEAASGLYPFGVLRERGQGTGPHATGPYGPAVMEAWLHASKHWPQHRHHRYPSGSPLPRRCVCRRGASWLGPVRRLLCAKALYQSAFPTPSCGANPSARQWGSGLPNCSGIVADLDLVWQPTPPIP